MKSGIRIIRHMLPDKSVKVTPSPEGRSWGYNPLTGDVGEIVSCLPSHYLKLTQDKSLRSLVPNPRKTGVQTNILDLDNQYEGI